MEKINVKNIVKFRRRSEKTKLGFLNTVHKENEAAKKPKEKGEGGDYWVSCVTAINRIFSKDDTTFLSQKIEYLHNLIKITEKQTTKDRHQKNIDLLYVFDQIDYKRFKPNADLTYHKKATDKSVININGIKVEIKLSHVFSYKHNDFSEIGAIWFIAFKNGFEKTELAMFCDVMHRYLVQHYSANYKINPRYCIAVDLFNGQDVTYSQLESGEIKALLNETVDKIKALL